MTDATIDRITFERLEQWQHRAFGLGGAALLLGLVGAVISRPDFYRAYLVAYLYWLGIPLGCLAVLMLNHLVSGRWGFVVQRFLEAAARTLPLMALLFVPLLFGLGDLYLWARPDAVTADPLLGHKQRYLNLPFFTGRAVLYFAIWIGVAWLLTRWSRVQDRTGDPLLTRAIKRLSAPGLVLYAFTMTFAAVDWVMSLEPHWFSTIFGAIFLVGQTLAAFGFAVVVALQFRDRRPLLDVLTPDRFHNLGNLLLTFVILWTYMTFSQYLIIWSGNLPEEIAWYLRHLKGSWRAIAVFLGLFYFAVPLFLLLLRAVKRRPARLAWVAAGLLVVRLVDIFWMVVPTFRPTGVSLHWLDATLLVALGGIWFGTFCWQLKQEAILPLHDPRFASLAGGSGGH